jgi:hypothetical protein
MSKSPIRVDGTPTRCTVTLLRPTPLAFASQLLTPYVPKNDETKRYWAISLDLDHGSETYNAIEKVLLACFKAQVDEYQKGGGRKRPDPEATPLRPRMKENEVVPGKYVLRLDCSADTKYGERHVPIKSIHGADMKLQHELGPGSLVCAKFNVRIYGDNNQAREIGLKAYLEGVVPVTIEEPSGGGFTASDFSEIQLDGVQPTAAGFGDQPDDQPDDSDDPWTPATEIADGESANADDEPADPFSQFQ